MEKLLGDTIKSIEQVIEQQRVIYESLISKAETDEEKKSLNELLSISNNINEALKNKDVSSLTNILNEIQNANNASRQ